MFRYLLYGLKFESTVAFSELAQFESEDLWKPDVTVQFGDAELPEGVKQQEHYLRIRPERTHLHWLDTGSFLIRNGREIVVEPTKGVADVLLRPLLLGPVIALLLHQRNFLVLHTSAVALHAIGEEAHCVGFMGHSGEGKSTMATAMYRRGHQAMSDDYLAVPLDAHHQSPKSLEHSDVFANVSKPQVFPGLPHLKLRTPSVEAFGESIESLPLWHPDRDGYLLRVARHAPTQSVALRSLYLLQEAPTPRIEPLPAPEALMALVNNSYCVRALQAQDTGRNFLQCAQLLQRVPVFRLSRPRDLERLTEVAALVEEHQANLASTP